MTQQQAFDTITHILGSVPDLRLRIPLDQLKLTHQFRRDLGFDSLAMIALFTELQEKFPSIEETQIALWITVQDCVESLVT